MLNTLVWVRRKASLNFGWLEDSQKWIRTFSFVIAFHVPQLAGETITLHVVNTSISYDVVVLFHISVEAISPQQCPLTVLDQSATMPAELCVWKPNDCNSGDGGTRKEIQPSLGEVLFKTSTCFSKDALRFTGSSKEQLYLSVLNSHGTSPSGCVRNVKVSPRRDKYLFYNAEIRTSNRTQLKAKI